MDMTIHSQVSPTDVTARSFDLVVSGKLLLGGGRLQRGEIGIADGRIVAIGELDTLRGRRRLDVGDSLVLPGLVDVHVHTGSDPSDGIERTTVAAAAGGVTTIVDMPYDDGRPVMSAEVLAEKVELVEATAVVDVGLYGTITKRDGVSEIAGMHTGGALAFKFSTFETDPLRFPGIPDDELLLAMAEISRVGALAAFHPENDAIVRRLTADNRLRRDDPMVHAISRPPVAETEAIGRILEFALATNARVHLCHVSVARGFELVARARKDGVEATAETCAHYLVLDDGEFARQGGRVKINPPLRSRTEVEALWKLLADGGIDVVSSDHIGWRREWKHTESLLDARSGAPSMELTLPLLYTEGVVKRGLPLARLLEVLSEAPARRFGLWPRKGTIALGADADLVVFDPSARWRVDEAELTTAAGWSPYHGRDIVGRVTQVISRGDIVVAEGKVRAAGGRGRALLQDLEAAI
jgi:allantoinase